MKLGREAVVFLGPKDALSLATQESGGVMKVGCLSEIPSGPRQGYYRKQLQKVSLPSHVQGGEKQDELFEVLLRYQPTHRGRLCTDRSRALCFNTNPYNPYIF